MIDPKLDKIPVKPTVPADEVPADAGTAARRPRAGLSIKDTVAGDTTLSVGARGVDTSGTLAGAGAGAGMTNVSTAPAGSPAPEIVPGARTSGTTTRADNSSSQIPTARLDDQTGSSSKILDSATTSDVAFEDSSYQPEHHEVSALAHEYWQERGGTHGNSEEDWHRAERELRSRGQRTKTTTSGL